MRVGGRHKNLTHADRGGPQKSDICLRRGGVVQNGLKNADVIKELPLKVEAGVVVEVGVDQVYVD